MSGRFGRWLELPPCERWVLLGMMVGLPVISASLWVFGVVRTRRWLERLSSSDALRNAEAADLQSSQRMSRLAEIAGRRGAVPATCLRQSLLVYWLLRRRGFAPELKIGVRKRESLFDAHAWVELQGVPLGQANLSHTPFPNKEWAASTSRL